jgi:hypothetical protein
MDSSFSALPPANLKYFLPQSGQKEKAQPFYIFGILVEDQKGSCFQFCHYRLSAQPFDGPPSFFTVRYQKSHALLIDKDRFTLAVPGNTEPNILHNILPTYYSSIGLYGLNPENSGHVSHLLTNLRPTTVQNFFKI